MAKVIFKLEKSGDVFAAFPEFPGDMNPANMCSYAHVGQHGAASMHYVADCKPATPEQYAALLKELVAIGYDDLRIVRKMSRADFQARKDDLNRDRFQMF